MYLYGAIYINLNTYLEDVYFIFRVTCMFVISFRPIMIIESLVSKVYIQITPVTLSAKRP